jgi:ferredoxin
MTRFGKVESLRGGRHPALQRGRFPKRRVCGRRGGARTERRARPTTTREDSANDDDDVNDDDDDEQHSSSSFVVVIADVLDARTPEETLGITRRRREGISIEEKASIRKAFSERIKRIHPDVCNNERGSEEATEKCVRAYAYLLSNISSSKGKEDEGFVVGDFDDAERDVFGSVFVNEIACVGVSNCPSYCNCTNTAREYFSTNPKTGAARFDRSEKSNAVKTATEAEQYSLHLAQQQCPRLCIHWLDKSQTKACETELQKAIDGLEMIDDTALRLEYMISAFTAENRLVERELRAAENRRARTQATTSTTHSWWK